MDTAWIADRLAIQGLVSLGRERVGPCPTCGGRDRFSINTAKRVYNCRRCGATGGNIDLVMFVLGLDFPAALTWLCGSVEGVSDDERRARIAKAAENKRRNDERAERERQKALAAARHIWQEGRPAEDSPVRDYLGLRGIGRAMYPRLPISLRYHPDLSYTVLVDRDWIEVHRGPAMLAAVQGPDGRFRSLHRTWFDLDRPRGKAQILHPVSGQPVKTKKTLGPKKGGAIRLTPPASVMVMAEGIETTLSALVAEALPGAAYWAGVDLGNMSGQRKLGKGLRYAGIPDLGDAEAFVPPACVERLIYVMDGDSDPRTTRAQLESGLRRAMVLRPGLRGQIVHAGDGVDLNDVLMGQDAEASPHQDLQGQDGQNSDEQQD